MLFTMKKTKMHEVEPKIIEITFFVTFVIFVLKLNLFRKFDRLKFCSV